MVSATAISFTCYCCVLIPSKYFWIASVISLAIPGILAFNFLLFLITFIFYRRYSFFPGIAIIVGYPFIISTYQLKKEAIEKPNDISVLSFNVKFFRERYVYNEFSEEAIQWAANDYSSIKCFQEYSTNNKWESLDVTRKISEKGYESFIFQTKMKDHIHNPGMAIFSKYPIIRTGNVWINENSSNNGIYADIKINKDTIRVYNVHLTSIKLSMHSWSVQSLYRDTQNFLATLKNSAIKRSSQVEKLIQHFNDCRYPIIICGDFNETPYSYNYYQLKWHVANSFEKSGEGFGFTYNDSPFILRIDHQFFNKKIISINYQVEKNIEISDHFPTRGIYRINQEN